MFELVLWSLLLFSLGFIFTNKFFLLSFLSVCCFVVMFDLIIISFCFLFLLLCVCFCCSSVVSSYYYWVSVQFLCNLFRFLSLLSLSCSCFRFAVVCPRFCTHALACTCFCSHALYTSRTPISATCLQLTFLPESNEADCANRSSLEK